MEKFRTVTKEDRREMGRPVGMYMYEGKIYPLHEDTGDYFVPLRAENVNDSQYFEWWRLSRIEVKELFLTNIMDELLRAVVDAGYTLNAASFSMEEKGPWDKKVVMQEKKKVVAGVFKYLVGNHCFPVFQDEEGVYFYHKGKDMERTIIDSTNIIVFPKTIEKMGDVNVRRMFLHVYETGEPVDAEDYLHAEPVTEIFLTQGNRILVLEELPVVRDTLASAKNIVALTEVFLNDNGFITTKTVVIGISNILSINRSDIFVDNMRWSRF